MKVYKFNNNIWESLREEVREKITAIVIYDTGNKYWYKEGKNQREGGPSIECADGGKIWSKEGMIHREGGPAVEWVDGDKFWYKEGKYHREDGPAIEYKDGSKSWYLEGRLFTEAEYWACIHNK